MNKREKYFMCPRCENITTKTEIDKEKNSIGYGVCNDCTLKNGNKLVEYEEIGKTEYFARKEERRGKK